MRSNILSLALLVCFAAGCVDKPPASWKRTSSADWKRLEIPALVDYDKAWTTVTDVVSRSFDCDTLNKENGYVQTKWIDSWGGKVRDDYFVRLTVKFSTDHRNVDIRAEAKYEGEDDWELGTDTELQDKVFSDLAAQLK